MIYFVIAVLTIDFILWYIFLFLRSKKQKISEEDLPYCSVLIMARNEENHISSCIDSLLSQVYPKEKYEILVCDDNSTDGTAEVLKAYENNDNVRLFSGDYPVIEHLNNKAQGLDYLAKQANGEVLLFTDADCVMKDGWLKNMAAGVIKNNKIVIAPTVPVISSFLSALQRIDWIMALGRVVAVQGIGIPVTGNGNNMAMPAKAYKESGGYKATHSSHTEDAAIFYLVREKTGIGAGVVANNRAIAQTQPKLKWQELVSQRLRWWLGGISEAPGWLIFYLAEALWILVFIALLISGFSVSAFAWLTGRIVLRVLYNCSLPFSFKKIAFFYYISAVILFDFYSIILNFTVLVKWGLGKSPEWKGREVRS
ncbi:glycosyltransferase [Mangrovivirga sp. M17]|uniref:Glycosyltransferase n=1 Tax=Mangrovivirga halotolerans TaxID=2993936 RepID=A0ABT3RPZ1_9BACT|nr:glycosyltransferase [Mangrovivirga halotolerans]MCX2743701.1 glycosyltransferase [Mangrovivirga halotolerans]